MSNSTSATKSLIAALAFATTFGAANAETVRDHRGPQVRDHRTICIVGDPNCRDHREPIVVVPPRGQPPVVVVDTPRPPRPQRPHVPIDPGTGGGNWGHDENDYDQVSCREGRQIVRENGFRHVRAFDCDGRIFGYRAENRHGGAKIRLTNRGEIISIQYYTY